MDENDRYSKKQILLSEELYDKGFQAPGGKSFVTLLLNNITNNPKNILVFGCGTGGTVLLISQKFPNSGIIAVDKSFNMIEICKETYNLKNVSFIQNDGISGSFFSSEQFDLIWSRDVILYIEQKQLLFTNFNNWLQYNGQIIICDFGSNIYGKEIKDYCDHKSYFLVNKKEYCDIIKKTGFINITVCDNTDMFLTSLNLDPEIYNTLPETLTDLSKYMGYYYYDILNTKVLNLFKNTMNAIEYKICNKSKIQNNVSFQLFGADIIFDKELNPFLLEFNKGPAMKYITTIDEIMKIQLTEDVFRKVKIINDDKDDNFIKLN